MDSLQFVIITRSEISTQKTLIFKKISVFICRKLVFLCLLFWSAYLRGGFHLELVHCVAGFRDVDVGRITVRHVVASPCLFSGNHLSISFTRSFSASAPIMNANSRREFQKKRGSSKRHCSGMQITHRTIFRTGRTDAGWVEAVVGVIVVTLADHTEQILCCNY